ncbi:MAG: Asp-tRNA(Asn)/Glu-tRNA(Gln) amidotransferase subunit GatC [Gemmatimonadales bacterium]
MSIEEKTIRHIAALAELAVTDQEVTALASQLDRIVAFVAKLEEADVPVDAPEYAVGPAEVALREDVVAPEPMTRTPEMLAPDFRNGLYVVPRLGAMEDPE